MVYNCRGRYEAGGTPLISTGSRPGGRAKELRTILTLLALVPVMLVFAGCGSAGSGGSSQASGEEERRASRTAGSSTGSKSAEDSGDGPTSKAKLGHPSLGSADAPVVLTEYSDYQ